MAKYKVKVIAHLCKNNHLAKFGEEIDETQLTSNAADLVNAGFIELVEEVELIQEEVSKDSDLFLETTDEAKDIKVDDAKEVKSDKKK
jgi:hypothetical protein